PLVMSTSTLLSCSLLSLLAPAPPAIYTLSLHDALPICFTSVASTGADITGVDFRRGDNDAGQIIIDLARSNISANISQSGSRLLDRKSTRLNSSHVKISYAVFCLKKKKPPRQRCAPLSC